MTFVMSETLLSDIWYVATKQLIRQNEKYGKPNRYQIFWKTDTYKRSAVVERPRDAVSLLFSPR